MSDLLEVAEGLQRQGGDEELCWQIDTTNIGDSPINITAKAYIGMSNDNEVTDTVFPTNDPHVNGNNIITLSPLKNLAKSTMYKIDVKFDISPNTWECYFRLQTD